MCIRDSVKGVSPVTLRRDLGMSTQKPAWLIGQKIRKVCAGGNAVSGVGSMALPYRQNPSYEKRAVGRPRKYGVESLGVPAKELAEAIFRANDNPV